MIYNYCLLRVKIAIAARITDELSVKDGSEASKEKDLSSESTGPSEKVFVRQKESNTFYNLSIAGKLNSLSSIFEIEPLVSTDGSEQVDKSLTIVGEHWEWTQSKKTLQSVTDIALVYIKHESILRRIVPVLPTLTALKTVRLTHNKIDSLRELQELIRHFVDVHHLYISNSAVCLLDCLRSFCSVHIPDLRTLNGSSILPNEAESMRVRVFIKHIFRFHFF